MSLTFLTFLKILHLLKKKKKINTQAKTKNINELEEGSKDKPLHDKYPIRASDPTPTHLWLASSDLKSETEGLIITAQDQSRPTKNFQANILKNGADPKCRACDKHTETIDHLASSCPILAPTEYLNRNGSQVSTSTGVCVKTSVCHMLPEMWYFFT